MNGRTWLPTLLALAASVHSEACGPDFQVMVTTCGRACVRHVTTRWFTAELNAEFPGRLAAQLPEERTYYMPPEPTATTRTLGAQGLTPEQADLLTLAMNSATGPQAYTRGAGLPGAVRLYAAGAVEMRNVMQTLAKARAMADEAAFRPREDAPAPPPFPNANLKAAIGYFQQILAMPPALSGNRRLWAQYSLGRALRLQGTPAAREEARKAFLAVLQRLDENIADPLDLRSGAYGELGRLALADHRLAEATQWYFKQGHLADPQGAAESLQTVAEATLQEDTATLVRNLQDPDYQRLVAIYMVCRLSDSWAREGHLEPQDPPFAKLRAALWQLPPSQLVAHDRFGALAFQIGDFKLASALLKNPQQAFGHWVAAKLALYQGNLDEAVKHFAEAANGFPLDTIVNDTNDLQRRMFQAEWALLNLTRGDYAEALRQMERLVPPWEEILKTREASWPAKYQWQRSDWLFHRRDVAWLAERVMTSAELMAYVDANPKATWLVRNILARRLVREGKLEAAARYASTLEDKARIERYASELATRDNKELPLATRARAAVAAANLLSREGMELRGADLAPDFASLDGSYELSNIGASDLAPKAEHERVASSAVKPAVRFHYRRLAAEELLKFSKTLPARTKLLSAVLCAGAGMARHGPGDRREREAAFFKEYRQRGLPITGNQVFGEGCPEI